MRPALQFRSSMLACALLVAFAATASAEQVSRESDIVNLRLGQRVLVDDGSCPAGQIKQVTGSKLTTAGVMRTSACVARRGSRR